MSFRPQFAFQTPAGFRDEQFHYSFDSTNVPSLGNPILAGGALRNVPLQLQNDAEFILRSWKVQLGVAVSGLFATIRDPYGNFLSATPLPFANYLTPAGAITIGQMEVPFESEIVCPVGGFLQLFLYNVSTGSITPPQFTLYGVNRRQDLGRAA
jgi:hypothetical protein